MRTNNNEKQQQPRRKLQLSFSTPTAEISNQQGTVAIYYFKES
jgi:hypothetical protein